MYCVFTVPSVHSAIATTLYRHLSKTVAKLFTVYEAFTMIVHPHLANKTFIYNNLSKIHPGVMDLRNSSKHAGGGHFLKVVIFFSRMCSPHTHALLMYACHFCHALAYAITANGIFLRLLGPPLRFH